MAIATYSTDLTTMDEADSFTGWAEPSSTWTALRSPSNDTDDFIQNSSCNSGIVKSGLGGLLYNNGSGITLGQDDAVLIWAKWDAAPLLDTEAAGGMVTFMGSASNAFDIFYQLGNDSYVYGGWRNLATGDPADASITASDTVGSPSTTKQYHGWGYGAPGSVPSKGAPFKVDAVRYGRCEIIAIDGQAAAYGNFADMAQENDYNDGTNGYNRWGLFQEQSAGNYLWKGLMSLGNATAVDFRDTNSSISIDNTKHVTPGFNSIEINNASSRVDWTGVTISSLGTVSAGSLEVIDNADVNFIGCTFNDMGTHTYLANSDVTDSQFIRCGQIAHGGGIMNGTAVSGYEGTADTSALVYDVAADPNGEMDDMSFTMGSALTHAIEFGLTSPLTMTLTGIDFSGYHAGNGETSSVLHIKRTTGTVNITIDGGSGTVSYKTDGADVNIISGAVTVQVTAVDGDGDPIENARVLLKASDGTGAFPFADSVTISKSGTTATVVHNAHGMATNDYILIRGANEVEYNLVAQITFIDANSYSYVIDVGAAASATGTIIATFVALYGLTAANGIISTSRVYTTLQPLTGYGRKSTSAPYFKQGTVNGDVSTTTGLSGTAVMVSDE